MLDKIKSSCLFVSNNSKHLKLNYSKLDEFKKLLKGNIEIPLLKERYKTITNVSKIVKEKMSGSFYSYIKNIVSDIELFDVIVNNFESFKDERTYKGKTIYFYRVSNLTKEEL